MKRTLSECMIISRLVLLRIRNVSDKICGGEDQTTQFMFSAFLSESLAFYEMRQYTVSSKKLDGIKAAIN